jgi:hypothetical protein
VVRVELVRDDVAGVFVATSPDLHGLVAEANTASELIQSVHDCADMLMDELVKVKAAPCVTWDGQAVMAAAGAALTPLPIA